MSRCRLGRLKTPTVNDADDFLKFVFTALLQHIHIFARLTMNQPDAEEQGLWHSAEMGVNGGDVAKERGKSAGSPGTWAVLKIETLEQIHRMEKTRHEKGKTHCEYPLCCKAEYQEWCVLASCADITDTAVYELCLVPNTKPLHFSLTGNVTPHLATIAGGTPALNESCSQQMSPYI